MRLLQLLTGPDQLLDLHPHVTIVRGIDDGLRQRLIDAVLGLVRGEAVGDGLLEAHGVLFPLDQAHLDELELRGLDVDPIVRRADLPGQQGSVDARELAAQQDLFASLLERIARRAEEQSRARDELAAAAAARNEARDALEAAKAGAAVGRGDDAAEWASAVGDLRRDIEARLLDEWAEREHAAATRAALETQVAQLREAVDVASARTLGIVAALEQMREVAEQAPRPEPASAPDADLTGAAPDRAAALDGRLAELDKRLVALEAGDVRRLDEALGLLRAGTAMVPSSAARSLAEEIEALDARIGDQSDAEAAASVLAAARTRLEDARQGLLEAEQAARSPVLSRDDVDELERAHDALLEAIERADGRFSGGRAHRRVAERRIAEQEVLDRLGFRSYAEYVMGSSSRRPDPSVGVALAAARAELQAAEDEWRALGTQAEDELARAALLDARRALSDSAASLLGRRVERAQEPSALRDLRVPAVAPSSAIESVRSVLQAAGIELAGEDLDLEELTALAEAAVEAARDGEARRLQLIEERAALEDQRRALAASDDADQTPRIVPDPPGGPDGASDPRRSDERAALEAELASARELEQAAVAALDAVRAELDAAAAAEAALAELVRGSEAELDRVVEPVEVPPDADDPLSELAAALEAADRAHQRALRRVEVEDRELAVLDEEGRSLAAQIERQVELVAAHDEGATTTTDELEWYLLARLARQRSVSVAGSVPLVLLDDVLAVVEPAEARRLLDRLERMTDAVQVIVVSDDPQLASWVADVGPARAAVVGVTAA